jgi:hypothetical protein
MLSIYYICLDKDWLYPQYHDVDCTKIKKPDELEGIMISPPSPIDKDLLDSIRGSLIGLALGDAMGAHVEFRPRQYLLEHPVSDLQGGGTWGLKQGQVFIELLLKMNIKIDTINALHRRKFACQKWISLFTLYLDGMVNFTANRLL